MDDPPSEIHIVNGLHPGLPFSYYEELLRGFQAHQARRAHEVLHGGRDPLLRAPLRHDVRGGPRRSCAPRGSGACPAEAPRSSTPTCARASRATRPPRTSTSRCTASPTASGCARTRRCSTGTSRPSSIGSTTCFACARSRTRPRGLQAFIPLAFHPDGNGMKNLPAPTAVDDLRTLAVSRLLLDNVDHIKAYWVEPDAGRRADRAPLRRRRHRRHHRARDHLPAPPGSTSPQGLAYDELVRLIREAGRIAGRARHALPRRPRARRGARCPRQP